MQHDGVYTCDRADTFQTYSFAPVSVTTLRLVFHVSKASAGIVEWKLLRPQDNPTTEPTKPTEPTTEPMTQPDAPAQKENAKGFFARLLDWLRSIFERVKRLFE